MNNCWMCGAKADSSEHKFKKSDIVRAYGRGPYSDDTAPVHFRGEKTTKIQGPDSRTLKYPKNLCADCNTTRSKPYDTAYQILLDWLFRNEAMVLHRRFINFQEVFGEDWQTRQLNLYRCFAKSFGCRLTEAFCSVPGDVVALFAKGAFQTGLRLSFSVNEDVVLMPPHDRDGFIGKGDLVGRAKRMHPAHVTGYTWDEHVSWFTTVYWYNERPDGNFGSIWTADSQHIYLGSHSPLPTAMRAEFMQKLAIRLGERAAQPHNRPENPTA